MRSFEFRSGALFLDLVDTVARRGSDQVDLIEEPDHIVRWALLSKRLPFMAGVEIADSDLKRLRYLREALHEAACAAIEHRDVNPDHLVEINEAASLRPPRVFLTAEGSNMKSDSPVDAMLAMLATEAIAVLGSDLSQRLRKCHGCSMVFLDNSRPGKRIWCSSSAGCGNQAKTRRHRESTQHREKHA
jgi:predicted RNA-binding Zn ribbon-like protein